MIATAQAADTTERDLHAGCGYCSRVHTHLVPDGDDDLVCAPGYGCAERAPRRHAPVARTRDARATPSVLAAPVLTLRRDPEACACGHTHADDAQVWCELVGGRLVAYCPACAPAQPPGGAP